MTDLGRAQSPQINHGNVFDRQSPVPRLPDNFYDRNKLAIFFHDQAAFTNLMLTRQALKPGDAAPAQDPMPAGFFITPSGDVRADVVIDSARLGKVPTGVTEPNNGFFPSLIPVRGNPTFGAGERANIFTGDGAGHLAFDVNGITDATGPVRIFSQLVFFNQTNGQMGAQVLHLWGQVYGFIFGKADSAFSDPNAFPNTLDVSGPNAEVYLQHAMVAYVFPIWQDDQTRLKGTVSIEVPETSVTPLDNAAADAKNWNSRSRIPDFACNIALIDQTWGHLQVAGLFRDVGIENTGYNENLSPTFLPPKNLAFSADHNDVFGWGVHVTGVFYPFTSQVSQDRFSFGAIYGRGIGNYINDLRTLGQYDAYFDANGHLRALPVTTWWGAYTHCWTPKLSSTLVYSQADVDGFLPAGVDASQIYRRGRYMAVNLVYQFSTTVYVAGGKSVNPTWYTGIEYLYGEKETLNNAIGVDHRVQLTVGAKF